MTKLEFEAIEIANYGKIDCCFKPLCDDATNLFNWYKANKAKTDSKFKADRSTITKTMMVELANLCSTAGKDVDFIVGVVKTLEKGHKYQVGTKIIGALSPKFDDLDMPI